MAPSSISSTEPWASGSIPVGIRSPYAASQCLRDMSVPPAAPMAKTLRVGPRHVSDRGGQSIDPTAPTGAKGEGCAGYGPGECDEGVASGDHDRCLSFTKLVAIGCYTDAPNPVMARPTTSALNS